MSRFREAATTAAGKSCGRRSFLRVFSRCRTIIPSRKRGRTKPAAQCVKVRSYGKPKRQQSHSDRSPGKGCRDQVHPVGRGLYEVLDRDEPALEGPAKR